MDGELSERKEDLEAYKKNTDALKAQLTEWEEKHRESVAERQSLQQEVSTLRLSSQNEQQTTATENQSLQQEIITLRSELEKTQAALKKASESAATETEKEGKRRSQEVADLKAALRKETKGREKAEKDLAKSKEDWETKHEVLESKLESSRNKLAALKASAASAPAPAPAATAAKTSTSSATASTATKLPAQNPKKRASTLTMEDLELSAKRPRKTPPKTSEFSITPFLKRQTAAADTSVANATTISTTATTTASAAVTSKSDAPDAPEAGETTMIPALIESKEPTKILLAGASRKRKAKNPTVQPDIPEVTAAEEVENPKPKPKPRKRKPAAAKALFTEDDGSGRLTLAPLAESQELSAPQVTATAAAATAGGKKRKNGKNTGEGGLAGALAGSASLLVPSVSAFNNEFSPSKKRPEGLKKLFGK